MKKLVLTEYEQNYPFSSKAFDQIVIKPAKGNFLAVFHY